MHLVVDPVACEFATISPLVFAMTVDVVVQEVSNIAGHVSPQELSKPIFLSELIVTFILSPIGPLFLALAMLFVIDPVTLILGSVSVSVLAKAMSLVITPHAVVDVSIRMN